MEKTILIFLGKILAYGGGAAAVAYGIFVFLGKKWIENKFQERLAAYKHSQNEELEELRYRINSLFSRVTKIHEKEFEVLPVAWTKMIDAIGHISRLVSVYQEYPDLNKMNEKMLGEFLNKSKLREYEKEELLKAENKLEYYIERVFWLNLNEVEQTCSDFHNFIIRNRIFLSSDLKEQFTAIDNILWDALTDKRLGHEHKDREMSISAYKQIQDKIGPIRDEIEQLVQKRLHYQDAL